MRPNQPDFDPRAYIGVPTHLFGAGDPMQWALVQELYRLALERTQAERPPAPTDRLAAFWN